MNNTSKVLVTIVFILVFFLISFMMIGIRQESGHEGSGFMHIIVVVGLIAAIRAVWKEKKSDVPDKAIVNEDKDKHQLDKS